MNKKGQVINKKVLFVPSNTITDIRYILPKVPIDRPNPKGIYS